jgi:hypothetical protein
LLSEEIFVLHGRFLLRGQPRRERKVCHLLPPEEA